MTAFAGSLGTSVFDPEVYLVGASGGVYALLAAHVANVLLVRCHFDYLTLWKADPHCIRFQNYFQIECAIIRIFGIILVGKCLLTSIPHQHHIHHLFSQRRRRVRNLGSLRQYITRRPSSLLCGSSRRRLGWPDHRPTGLEELRATTQRTVRMVGSSFRLRRLYAHCDHLEHILSLIHLPLHVLS